MFIEKFFSIQRELFDSNFLGSQEVTTNFLLTFSFQQRIFRLVKKN